MTWANGVQGVNMHPRHAEHGFYQAPEYPAVLGSDCAGTGAPFVAVNLRNGTWGTGSFLCGRPKNGGEKQESRRNYCMKLHALIAVSTLALTSAMATAQTAPTPADPSTTQNAQPAPSAPKPADPAASSNPA